MNTVLPLSPCYVHSAHKQDARDDGYVYKLTSDALVIQKPL